MMRLAFFFLACLTFLTGVAQEYTSSSIFAHNDYVQPVPFHTAYSQQVGFIEADIFLHQDNLLVAHTKLQLNKDKTLEDLYFKPLHEQIIKNNGFAYADKEKQLTLMIDLKTEGVSTLNKLVKELKNYPLLLSCKTLQITISGSVPDPARWSDYPEYIHFDGRPDIAYTDDQLKRISLISKNFKDHAKWNGKGGLTKSEREKIEALRDAVHAKGKKIRFWAAPDFTNAWLVLMELKIDIIGTDNVLGLAACLKNKAKNTFHNDTPHAVYRPLYNYPPNSPPKNIILMIGDGMGLTQLYGGYTANQGKLNIFTMQDIGFSITTSSDNYITDSAAGATAMASGTKTNNRYVGVDSLGNPVLSIAEKLIQEGFRTAIISSGDITDATPASFYAHQNDRGLNEEIASDFLMAKSDILIGGGLYAFKNRKDDVNLIRALVQSGYTVAEEFDAIDSIRDKKFVVLDDSAVVSKKRGRGDFLSRSLKKSLSVCSSDSKPFFIMLEGAQIDIGGHENDMEYVVREVLDFDQAVGEAMKFVDANKETLLIVTADHETGGLSLLGGNVSKGSVLGSFSTTDHTAVMVPVFSYGPGSEFFRGVFQNNEISLKIINEILRLQD